MNGINIEIKQLTEDFGISHFKRLKEMKNGINIIEISDYGLDLINSYL